MERNRQELGLALCEGRIATETPRHTGGAQSSGKTARASLAVQTSTLVGQAFLPAQPLRVPLYSVDERRLIGGRSEWLVSPTEYSGIHLTMTGRNACPTHDHLRAALFVICLALLFATGCRRDAVIKDGLLPALTWVDESTALQTLSARAEAVRNVQAEADLQLVRGKGDSVNLDGAVVLAPPEKARLKAWKFGQAVFDLTITPDGVWVLARGDKASDDKAMPASKNAAQFVRQWSWFLGRFFLENDLATRISGTSLIVSRTTDDGTSIVCNVDRATLTPRKYVLKDPQGVQRFELTLAGYQEIAGIVWPTHMVARGESGQIEVSMRNIEINTELAPQAFTPPRRAEKLP